MKSSLNFNTKLKITSHNKIKEKKIIGPKADTKFQSANSLLFLADFLLKLSKKMQPFALLDPSHCRNNTLKMAVLSPSGKV